jgi:hypothetical protein
MDEFDSFEIDNPMDFWLIQNIMKYKKKKKN